MNKRKNRRPFETQTSPEYNRPKKQIDTSSGVFGFLRDYGVRETVESIIVAVVLALMFRAYEAEAFIIPTGSMAPTLQGQHMDVECAECGYQYRAGASQSASSTPERLRGNVTKTYCPICRFGTAMELRNSDHKSFNGDRILVNKFVYDFQPPKRFDVIVFKNPNNGKQNYIKRLVGMPGDRLLIENGDIFNIVTSPDAIEIVRKPTDKIEVMLQLVDDTNFISKRLKDVGWPSRWDQWSEPKANWKKLESGDRAYFTIDSNDEKMNWLRYRHLAPRTSYDEFEYAKERNRNPIASSKRPTEWEIIAADDIPKRIVNSDGTVSKGALIRDYYEYNDRKYQFRPDFPFGTPHPQNYLSSSSHWVGDLAVECELQVESESGVLGFDLVEGGVHFQCLIDIASGEATLSTVGDDGNVMFDTEAGVSPKAQTNLKGAGNYKILYAQMDDMVYLFINNRFVDFKGSSYSMKSDRRPMPKYSVEDPGDAEPIGIAASGASVRVNRLKVFRDIYYVAPVNKTAQGTDIRNETGIPDFELVNIYEYPEKWTSVEAKRIFQRPRERDRIFELGPGQYFPMGDNSPASQDARIWDGPNFVDEEMLIGRAMFIYWPHSLNSPVKYFPNFKRMGFIR